MFNLLKHRRSIFWVGLGLLILCTLVYMLNFSSPIDRTFNHLFVNFKQSSILKQISDIVIIEIDERELLHNELWPWGEDWFPYLSNLLGSYDPKGILFLLPKNYKQFNIDKSKKNLHTPSVITMYEGKDLVRKEDDFLKVELFKKEKGKVKYSNFSRLLCTHYDCANNFDENIEKSSLQKIGFPFSTFPIIKGNMLINLVSSAKFSHFNYFNFLVNVQGLNLAKDSYDFNEEFKDKIIIFSSDKKSFSTFLGGMTTGEVYASAVYTAINSDFIRRGFIFSIPFILFTGILLFILFTKFNLVGRTATWVSSIFIIVFVCFYMYDLFGVLISPFIPILFSTLFYFNVNFFRLIEYKNIKLKLRKERLAWEIKREVIPSKVPLIEGGSMDWKIIPSQEVGGDFYNTSKFDSKVTIFLGSISEKGLKGAQRIESINNKLRLYYNEGNSLVHLFKKLNQDFRREASNGEIIRLLAAEIQPREGIVKFINTGQITPFVVSSRSSHINWIKSPDPAPLGLYENRGFTEQVFRLYENDLFVLLSEGMYELSNFSSGSVKLEFEKILTLEKEPASYLLDDVVANSEKILCEESNLKDRTLIVFKKE